MQLHEAAAQYLEHRQKLDNSPMPELEQDHVWRVKRDSFEDGYYLILNTWVGHIPSTDAPDNAFSEARTITKQRGGTRIFKTLDAVASALQQIGQPVLPLDELPKPDGL